MTLFGRILNAPSEFSIRTRIGTSRASALTYWTPGAVFFLSRPGSPRPSPSFSSARRRLFRSSDMMLSPLGGHVGVSYYKTILGTWVVVCEPDSIGAPQSLPNANLGDGMRTRLHLSAPQSWICIKFGFATYCPDTEIASLLRVTELRADLKIEVPTRYRMRHLRYSLQENL